MLKNRIAKITLAAAAITALVLPSAQSASAAESCVVTAGGNLVGCDFTGRDFFNYVVDGADFTDANLTNVSARYSYWVNTVLDDANLTGVNFYSSYMAGASFKGANLTGANFANVNLDGADLSGANLTGVISSNTHGTPAALPAGWVLVGGFLVGPTADLRGANLSGLDLTDIDLSNARLDGVRSGGVVGTPSSLPAHWGLLGGYFFGPGADLSGARLDGLDIWAVDLTGATLTGASINQTSINNSNLVGIKSGGLVGKFQQVTGARVQNGYILVPTANLAGADLRNTDLSHLNLDQADLSGALLRGADISNSSMTGADLTGADFTSANLSHSWLRETLMVNTNFTFANLTGVQMYDNTVSFGQFNGANLTDANLANTNITASEFYRTNFANTDLTGATFTSTRSGDVTGTPYALPASLRIVDGELMNLFSENLRPSIAGTYKTGQTATASLETLPAGAQVSYQWLRDEVAIQGANTASYLLTASDVMKNIAVVATVTKRGFLTSVEVSDAVVPSMGYMVVGTVNISGVMKAGKVIKAITRPWVDTVGVKMKYQWLRNGKPIKYATKSTYKVAAGDTGAKISVKVTQSLKGYYSASKTSAIKKVLK